jgi:hypothetical protein
MSAKNSANCFVPQGGTGKGAQIRGTLTLRGFGAQFQRERNRNGPGLKPISPDATVTFRKGPLAMYAGCQAVRRRNDFLPQANRSADANGVRFSLFGFKRRPHGGAQLIECVGLG